MSWDLGDLANWVNGLRDTFKGGNPNSPGNASIQAGIVNPLKIASDFTGVTQGYRGAKPNASVKDQGLALLALAGMLGGQEAALGIGKGVKNLTKPEYAYGIHINPTQTLNSKKIKPILNAELRYGPNAEQNMNAFMGFGRSPEQIPDKALDSALKWAYNNPDGSASIVRTPLKGIVKDSRSPVGWKTPKNLKAIKTMGYNFSDFDPYWYEQIMDEDVLLNKKLLKEFINKSRKATP